MVNVPSVGPVVWGLLNINSLISFFPHRGHVHHLFEGYNGREYKEGEVKDS